jgi:hypothetical protein
MACWDGEFKAAGGRDFNYERASTIRAGTTTEALVAALGQPIERSIRADGSEEWRYELLLDRASGFGVGVHVTVSHQRRKQEAVFIIHNGRVMTASVNDQLL